MLQEKLPFKGPGATITNADSKYLSNLIASNRDMSSDSNQEHLFDYNSRSPMKLQAYLR